MIDGEFIINPTADQKRVSDLALTVASTREKVIMIEAGANEVPEQTVIDAIFKAHEVNQEIIRFIDTIVAECGKENTHTRAVPYRRSFLLPSASWFRLRRWKRLYLRMTSRTP